MTEDSDRPAIDDVRRLLAEARHTGPMPDDVATRMDAVLADLAHSGGGEKGADPQVVSLAAHRRRRAAGLLVAAAAIVVGGVAVAQQLPHGQSPASPAAGSAVDRSRLGPSSLGTTGNAPKNNLEGHARQPGASPTRTRHGRVVVHPQHFSADALAGRALIDTKSAYDVATPSGSRSCIDAPAHSVLLNAVFRHAPAVLVYHRPAGSTQVVDLFVCGSRQPLRSVTLPTD